MKKITILTILFFILFTGCVAENEVTDLPEAPNVNTVQFTESAQSTQPTATVIHIQTNTTKDQLITCKPSDDILKGKIVYNKPGEGLYFYDLMSEERNLIPNTADAFSPFVAFSPDHTRIAFFDFDDETGWIISNNGNRVELNTKERIDGVFYGWLDNATVIFVDRSRFDGSIITLDVDTGIINKTVTGLQDLFSLGPNRWYAGGNQPTAVFDSPISRLIYLSGELPGEPLGKWGFIMRDVETQKILWSRPSDDLGVRPKWSPDNTRAAILIANEIIGENKIYIVNKDGQENQIIDTSISDTDLIEWSPDGTKISYSNESLVKIYSFASNQTQEYQIPKQVIGIIWSPSGDQIAINDSIVDLFNDCVFHLFPESNIEPLAWLVNAP